MLLRKLIAIDIGCNGGSLGSEQDFNKERSMPDKKRFSVAQVATLCGGELPQESGFTWERVEYFLLEDGVLQPYSDGTILPGPGIRITARSEGVIDPWTELGNQLRQYMKQVTDERLDALYQKLYAAGWAEPRPSPLSTRHAKAEIEHLVMQAVAIETIERREGRIPSVK